MVGKHAGRIRGSTALPNDKSRSCSRRRNRHCCHCRSNPSATTSTETARFIWTAVWKSRLPITAHPQAGSGRWIKVQWDGLLVRLLDPKNGQLLREHIRQKRGCYRIKEEDHPSHSAAR